MLAFLRDANTARSVTDIFNNLQKKLDIELFQRLFPVILTDRGSEFTDPFSIECDFSTGELRTIMLNTAISSSLYDLLPVLQT